MIFLFVDSESFRFHLIFSKLTKKNLKVVSLNFSCYSIFNFNNFVNFKSFKNYFEINFKRLQIMIILD